MRVPFVLTLITPRAPDLARLRDALAALPPGAAAVQLRQPDGATRRALAQPIATLCRDHGAALLVNDDLPLAAAIGADGAQLPERGPSVAAAREALGEAAWIGVSRHDAPGLRAARDAQEFDGRALDDYEVLSLNARFNLLPRLELFGRLENLLDEDYQEVPGYRSSGQALYAGIRYHFQE